MKIKVRFKQKVIKELNKLKRTKLKSHEVARLCGCSASYVRTLAVKLGVTFPLGRVRMIGEYTIKHGVTKCCKRFDCSATMASGSKWKVLNGGIG